MYLKISCMSKIQSVLRSMRPKIVKITSHADSVSLARHRIQCFASDLTEVGGWAHTQLASRVPFLSSQLQVSIDFLRTNFFASDYMQSLNQNVTRRSTPFS